MTLSDFVVLEKLLKIMVKFWHKEMSSPEILEEPEGVEAIYHILQQSILAGDSDVEDLISLFPLEFMKVSTSNQLLVYYLQTATVANNAKAVKIILDKWTDSYPMELLIPFRTILYTISEMDVNTLSYVEEVYDHDRSYLLHMLDLVTHDSIPEVETACLKLYKVFGEQHPNIYQDILDEVNIGKVLIDTSNYAIRDFITQRYRNVSGYAEIPSWIDNELDTIPTHQELIDGLPQDKKISFVIPDNETAVELMLSKLGEFPGTIIDNEQDLREDLYERLTTVSASEKIEMLRPVISSIEAYKSHTNPELFRVLGPAHPMLGWNTLEDDGTLETAYGGSRMFLSYVFHGLDESGHRIDEDIENIHWFSGACDFCNLKIRALHHAVRMPMEGGGWMGTYCGFKCLKKSTNNPLGISLIESFEQLITDTAIQDRRWPRTEIERPSPESMNELMDAIDNIDNVADLYCPIVIPGLNFSITSESKPRPRVKVSLSLK